MKNDFTQTNIQYISPYRTALRALKYKQSIINNINHTYLHTMFLVFIPVFIAGLIPNDIDNHFDYVFYVVSMIFVCLLTYICLWAIKHYFELSVLKTHSYVMEYEILFLDPKEQLANHNLLIPAFEYVQSTGDHRVTINYPLEEYKEALNTLHNSLNNKDLSPEMHSYVFNLYSSVKGYVYEHFES